MLRQGSSRNQRSKGFKVKHALQIFVLLAICIWLVYQVKHSHEKKRAFEEINTNKLKAEQTEADTVKLPRKFLPSVEERSSENVVHKDEENVLTQDEEQDTNQEEVDDVEGRHDGDDEIGELDHDKDHEEAEDGDESTEQDDDSHDENTDGHDEGDLFKRQDHEAGTQEAREENYKRDDASSAVSHDADATHSEDGSGNARSVDDEQAVDKVDGDDESSDTGSKRDDDASDNGSRGNVVTENVENEVPEAESATNQTDDGSQGVDVSNTASNGSDTLLKDHDKNTPTDNPSNVTATVANVDESTLNSTQVESNYQAELQTNSTTAAESNTQMELQANSTGAVHDAVSVSVSNDTDNSNSAHAQNTSVDNATIGEGAHNSESNTTVLQVPEREMAQGKSDDSSHAAISEEERETRTDLPTLPDIQNEAKPTNDEAAA